MSSVSSKRSDDGPLDSGAFKLWKWGSDWLKVYGLKVRLPTRLAQTDIQMCQNGTLPVQA